MAFHPEYVLPRSITFRRCRLCSSGIYGQTSLGTSRKRLIIVESLIRSALVTQSHDLHRIGTARQLLADRYNLEKNPDMRVLDAERFFGASNWDACYTITSR
jgi:hypothetical protein